MKVPFIDVDALIEESTRKTISEIFYQKGEEYFRKKEAKVLRGLLKIKKAVVATGGGLPCFGDNLDWMNENGRTVYLEASAAFLFHRLHAEKKSRPLINHLTDVELMIYITETLASRRKYYSESHIKVNAETTTAGKILASIKKKKLKK